MQHPEADLEIVQPPAAEPGPASRVEILIPILPAPARGAGPIGEERQNLTALQDRLAFNRRTAAELLGYIDGLQEVVRKRLQALADYERAVLPSPSDPEIPF